MGIPKELQRKEVQKFEDWIMSKKVHDVINIRETVIADVRDFYTQQFKPEMIEEYFEGWKGYGADSEMHNQNYEWIKGKDRVSVGNSGNIYLGIKTIIPKTLSDFIDACLNSGIKLNWKQNAF